MKFVGTLCLGVLLLGVFPLTGLAQVSVQPSETTSAVEEQGDPGPDVESDEVEGAAAPLDEPVYPEKDSYLEEIIVEGTRSQGIREVPISVTQFGASDIENLRIQNVADLSAYTPNLEINTAFAASNPTLFIRGVGLKDFNSNSTGAVGIWHDGIMMNSPMAQLFSIYDIESIEVLRGPIGGLRGRNATAGAIRIHSFKPDAEWSSSSSFTYGNLNELAFEAALGFPIFPETFDEMVSARIAVVTEFRDGYTDNVCAGWDPTEFGLLPSTEAATREFYALLDPSSVRIETSGGSSDVASGVEPRFIYQNFEAIQQFNNALNEGASINQARLLDGPGGTPGTRVGIQKRNFQIGADNVCVLGTAGNLTTFEGAARRNGPPEGTFRRNTNTLPLSHYQDLKERYNNIKYWGARAQLLFQPTDTMDFLANFHWGQNRGDSFHLQAIGAEAGQPTNPAEIITEPLGFTQNNNSATFSEILGNFAPFEGREVRRGLGPKPGSAATQGFAGNDPFNGFYSSDGLEKLDLYGGSITANFEFDWGRAEAISGYEFSSRSIDDEGDDCPCTPLHALIEDEAWQVTEELTATLEGDGYSVKLGAFFLHEDLRSRNFFKSSLRAAIDQNYSQTTDAANVGADAHYDFFEEDVWPGLWQISLDAGFRYNWEQKSFALGSKVVRILGGTTETIPEESVGGEWDALSGEVTLSYKPLENARLYAKYTRGFKAGHFNAGLTIQPDPACVVRLFDGEEGLQCPDESRQTLDPVADEYVHAAEVGLKSSWFDDRVELSGAVFRYWYSDMQVFDIVNEPGTVPTQQLLNADASVLGAEIELTLRPLEGLMFQGGFGWLDATYGEFIVEKVVVAPRGRPPRPGVVGTFNYEGNSLIAAPKYSASGYLEYELPLSRWGSVVPSADFSYKSQTFLDVKEEELISQAGYWLFNARLAYRTPGGSIEIAGWVQNFLNETYKIDAFDESRGFLHILEIWGEPRTYGMTISYYFSADD